MKLLSRGLLFVLLLLLLALSAAGGLLGTAGGLAWLAQQADQALPGSLQIEHIEGGLFGRLQLRKIHYQDPQIQAEVDELILHWHPEALLSGSLRIAELSLSAPRITQLSSTETQPDPATGQPFALPELLLPLQIHIDRAAVRDLRYRTATDAPALQVDELLLAADWTAKGIGLRSLKLAMPGIGLQADGDIAPHGRYPLDLNTQLSLDLPEAPKASAKGRIHGDLDRLDIQQQVSGDLQAALTAVLRDPLGPLNWQVRLDLQSVPLQALTAHDSGRLAGTLSAKGDLKQATADGQLRLVDATEFFTPWNADLKLAADLQHMGVNLQQVTLTRPDTPLRLDLSGSADADLKLDMRARWTALQWPPDGTAEFASERGDLILKGSADAYDVNLNAQLGGTQIPSGAWTLKGQGDRQRLDIQALRGKLLDGTLQAVGKVAWAPQPSWDVRLEAAAINPGAHYPEWPGKLDLALTSSGSIKDTQPDIGAVIKYLRGRLRDRPLNASGKVQVRGAAITLNDVRLTSGAAKIAANGQLGEASDLSWSININDMADLLPEAGGSLKGKGTVSGAMAEPRVNGKLSAEALRYQDMALRTLSSDIGLDLSDRTASRLALRAQAIRAAGQTIDELRIDATGRKRAHQLRADLRQALGDLSLRLQGAYNEAKTAWNGSLDALRIDSGEFGDWKLRKPVRIAAAPDDLRIDELCLARSPGTICAQAQLVKQQGQASINAERLQLAWLQAWLPPEIEQLDGALGLRAKATIADPPLLDATLSLSPGKLVVHPKGQELITLPHQGGQVTALLDARRLDAKFNLAIGEDGLEGRIQAPRPALDKEPTKAPLDGRLALRFRQLELFAGLLPMVQNLEGELLADLELGGTLGRPSIIGDAGLNLPRLLIPEVGLELNQLAVKAHSDDGKRLRLDGGVSSGGGRLRLGGDIDLGAGDHVPMHVTLKGDNFQLLNLPERNARIATDLAFNSGRDGMLLEGTLTVPKAFIVVNEIPEGAVSPSADVIVETPGAEPRAAPEKGAPFAMKVTVVSGKDVEFRGFGLKAYFEGKLTVNQLPGEFPTGSGELHIKEGTYKAYGQNLVIERGILAYSGGRIDNPGLSVRASRTANVDMGQGEVSVNVGVDVSGSAKKPDISVFSDPTMEERDAISILLTGNIASNLGKGGSIGVGKQLTKELSVGAKIDRDSSQTEFVTKYRFNRKFHLEATTSSEGNAADVFYSLQFD